MKKSVFLILLLAVLANLTGCKMSDIRTQEMQSAIDAPGSANKARELFQTTILAHGADQWENYETVSFDFREQFMKMKFASPFPGGGAKVKLDYVTDSYDARLTILDGKKKDEQWGLSDFYSWKKKAGAEIKWKHDKKIKFWLPTYQYFIQLPLKILEADYLRYGGKRSVSGINYDIVFASWKTDEPQKDFDQYAMYLNPKTHLIDIVEYTVRGAGNWFRGALFFEEYTQKEGLQIPGVMTVLGPKVDFEDRSPLHRMEVLGTEFNRVGKKELMPDRGE